MRRRKTDHSDAIFMVLLATALLVCIGLGIWWLWPIIGGTAANVAGTANETPGTVAEAPETSSATSGAETGIAAPKTAPAVKQPPVVRYGEPLETVQELMEQRKAAYGLDQSVDMVVKPEESIQVGDVTVPMSEILEKIRIKEGGVAESDLAPRPAEDLARNRWERLFSRLKHAENRFRDLEKEVAAPDAAEDPAAVRSKIAELNTLTDHLETFNEYKDTLSRQVETGAILHSPSVRAELERHVAELETKALKLEASLREAAAGHAGDDPAADPEETLKRLTARHDEIGEILADPPAEMAPDTLTALAKERSETAGIVKGYRSLEKLREAIAEDRALLNETDEEITRRLRARLMDLRIARDRLEDDLVARMLPEEEVDIYGIYVVRPGDNIWNIHFRFLTEYFNHRGITILPTADEPDERGISSGVGKILKFSEKMVYIYNIREGRLEDNLSLIHPLSKIVVFNMGRALALLKQLNAEDIHHIRFDGETLWLPAG